jgi:uncharacterized membrane protein
MSAAAVAAPKPAVAAGSPPPEPWYNAMAGVIVAAIGLIVLFGVVAIAIMTLPDDETKAQNVIAVASSAFGVIGTIVGAYFGVRAANRAVDKAHGKR